jgi:uncharacterized membrane protein
MVIALVLAVLLSLIPLAGIAWTLVSGSITTVDGLFMSLILLTLSGVFLFNVVWEVRLHRKPKAGAPQKQKSS